MQTSAPAGTGCPLEFIGHSWCALIWHLKAAVMATGRPSNASTFFGRNTTPSRVSSGRRSSRLTTSSALDLISTEGSREKRPRSRNAFLTSRYMNDENVLPYQPGMLLNDRPPVFESESEGEGEDNVYTFSEVQPSRNNPEITEIKVMVQQQQAMMRSILTNQDVIQERQALYEQKITQIEDKLVQFSNSPPSSSDASPSTSKHKRRRIVNRGISVSV